MIRACYLIFSHDWQLQLTRLANTIAQLSPNSHIVIHHDPSRGPLRTDLFKDIPAVRVVPSPLTGRWGQYSLVEQQLHALRFCVEEIKWDWIVTLSGQSYPLQPLFAFEQMLTAAPFDAFVRYFDALAQETWENGLLPRGEGERRYMFHYFDLPRFSRYYLLPASLRQLLGRLRRRINGAQSYIQMVPLPGSHPRLGIRRLTRRPLGKDFTLCIGRSPMQMNRKACEFVLSFVDANPSYVEYFRSTLIPDEGFFTSLLANAEHLRVKNDSLRYIKWNRAVGASRGAVILPQEVPEAIRSGKPFGLKFDMEAEPQSLELIDDYLKLGSSVGKLTRSEASSH